MTRRDLASTVVVVGAVVLFGLFAWLTREPEAPLFERASRLPLIGGVVERLRGSYLPPEQAERPRTRLPDRASAEAAPAEVAPASDGFLRAGLGEIVLLAPGAELRRAPHEQAALVERLDRARRSTVLEHAGDWVRVPSPEGGSAWVDPRFDPGWLPPLGMDPVPPTPLPGRPPSPERLEEARRVLGESAWEGRLGPYSLLTDATDEVLVAYLDHLASRAESDYVGRYGLTLAGNAAEAIVLFRTQSDYRRYESSVPRLSRVRAEGHAGRGVVSLYRGERSRVEVGMTLLHELGHLLNRRALGPALPSWLDEGLAEDFSHRRLTGRDGDAYRHFRLREGTNERLLGPLAALRLVGGASRSGRLEGPRRLLGRDWEAFAAGDEAPLHYAHAELWVRFLTEEADAAVRRGWRAYLDGVRRGESVAPRKLREHLGASWDELASSFESWVLEEAALAGLLAEPVPEGRVRGG